MKQCERVSNALDFSMLNWMVYFRGHSKDFDEWEEMGNRGWGWKDVLPFFKKAEKWTGPNPNHTYGTGGRFSVMPNPYINQVMYPMFDTLEGISLSYVDLSFCGISDRLRRHPRSSSSGNSDSQCQR